MRLLQMGVRCEEGAEQGEMMAEVRMLAVTAFG